MTEIRQRLYEPAVYITDTLPGEAQRDAARMARHRAALDYADDMMAARGAEYGAYLATIGHHMSDEAEYREAAE